MKRAALFVLAVILLAILVLVAPASFSQEAVPSGITPTPTPISTPGPMAYENPVYLPLVMRTGHAD